MSEQSFFKRKKATYLISGLRLYVAIIGYLRYYILAFIVVTIPDKA